MRYYKFFLREDEREPEDPAGYGLNPDGALPAFLTSFILTLAGVGLVAGLLFVDRSARMYLGEYDTAPDPYRTMRILDGLSALWSVVSSVFPYFAVAVGLFLFLCRAVTAIARAVS